MSGRLVGVGVGPGDPELLTVKGLRMLREADEIFVPVADTGEVGRAEATVREYVDEGHIRRLLFALSDNLEARERNWTNAAQGVSEHLRSGKTCAFSTIGASPPDWSHSRCGCCSASCGECRACGHGSFGCSAFTRTVGRRTATCT